MNDNYHSFCSEASFILLKQHNVPISAKHGVISNCVNETFRYVSTELSTANRMQFDSLMFPLPRPRALMQLFNPKP